MSCFIVNDRTISALTKAFVDYEVQFEDGNFHETFLVFMDEERKRIGQALLKQNYDSFNYRYGEKNEIPEFEYEDVEIDEGIVYGCMQCYIYQACETEDFFKSEVYKSFERLERKLLERLLKKAGMTAPYGYDMFE